MRNKIELWFGLIDSVSVTVYYRLEELSGVPGKHRETDSKDWGVTNES